MESLFITNVADDEGDLLGLPTPNYVDDEDKDEGDVIENCEEPLPLPSTFNENEDGDTDFSAMGEVGSVEETPLPLPSTAPERGERY